MSRKRKESYGTDTSYSFGASTYDRGLSPVIANRHTYHLYRDRLINIAVSVFEWKNLPPGVDSIYMEKCLLFKGSAIFFQEPMLKTEPKIVCLPFLMKGGRYTLYDEPTRREAYSHDSYRSRTLTPQNSVIVYNTPLKAPYINIIDTYAQRISDLQRTIDVNVKHQKTPYYILTTPETKLTRKNITMLEELNESEIYVTQNNFDPESLRVVPTTAPYVADKLQVLKNQYYYDCLSMLGVETSNTDKKERLISDEVTSGLGDTESERYVRLIERQKACDRVNRMFDLDISVHYRPTIGSMMSSYTVDENARVSLDVETDGAENE